MVPSQVGVQELVDALAGVLALVGVQILVVVVVQVFVAQAQVGVLLGLQALVWLQTGL